MTDLLALDGPLAALLPAMELRPSQVEMAKAVDRTLQSGGRLLVEAGPGTGKTFAYLLPVLCRAEAPARRVVVSTWTRNLQDQLFTKDLPLLEAALEPSVEVAVIQGRENYVCRRRATENLADLESHLVPGPVAAELRRVVRWAGTSRDGLRSSLPFAPLAEAWTLARAERGNCLHSRSPFFRSCAWQWARRRARDAGVLIVNHALLLADLKLRRRGAGILPPYSMLILDEAHHLEDVAADHLGVRLTRSGLFTALQRLGREVSDALQQQMHHCRGLAQNLFDSYEDWLGARSWAEVPAAEQPALLAALEELAAALHEACGSIPGEAQRIEVAARSERCAALAADLHEVLVRDDPDTVRWVERSHPRAPLAFCAAPIETGPILERELFDPLFAAVLTSATLRTPNGGDEFAFVRRSTGLRHAECLALSSPFDYQRQATLVIDPLPNPREEERYLDALAARLPRHVARTEGRAFVLFTSRRTMERVAERCQLELEDLGIELLIQGRGMPRAELLEQFRRAQPAALFGLASFWEGVDVAGEELSHVILTRLPFRVPGHPRDVARGERLRRHGQDPFQHQSLPEAILRLRQGFGRLIRTRSDRGYVTILDSRVISHGYGRRFLAALPACPRFLVREDEEIPLPPAEE